MARRRKKNSGATTVIIIIVVAILIVAAVVFAWAYKNESGVHKDTGDDTALQDSVPDTEGNVNVVTGDTEPDTSDSSDTSDDTTGEPEPEEHIEISDITVNENFEFSNGGTVTLSIQAPKLVSETYGENADVFNLLIATEIENLKNKYAKDIATDDTSEFLGASNNNIEYSMSYEVKKSSDAVVSVLLSVHSYTGGAHGHTVYKAVNFDLNSAKSIDMQYVTGVPAEEYTPFLKSNILEKMRNSTDNMYFSTEDGVLDDCFDDTQFVITESGITVFFQEYDIAPFAAGAQMFDIPYNELIELSSY
ncbi:MAG: DUF3298 domain-containing protein [Clostridia bacterium]|nr:DUF3298 domain-containing protein [Clostridia bacterium]